MSEGGGHEPDARFTLANERTYLAWLRTALGLIAGGVAVDRLFVGLEPEWVRELIGVILIVVGSASAALAHRRWRKVEEALRHDEPLPPPRFAQVLAAAIAISGALIIVLILTTPPD
jgi:putative membrane protein